MIGAILFYLRRLADFFYNLLRFSKPDAGFQYPYSTTSMIREGQIWDNLQKGLLLEDRQILVPWTTPFSEIGSYAEKMRKSGDRTEWYLGYHSILNGYYCHLEVMKWLFLPSGNPIAEIRISLGFDKKGHEAFHQLKDHLIRNIGEPMEIDLARRGEVDIGIIKWTSGICHITLSGIEHFNDRYNATIGLIHNRNHRYYG